MLLIAASSIVYSHKGEGDTRHSSSSALSGVLSNTTEMLRELFERSPGFRQGVLSATKQHAHRWPQELGQEQNSTPKPPLHQRALGKIFDAEPVTPYFDERSTREPFVLSPVLGDPLRDYTPRDLSTLSFNSIGDVGGNPPVYRPPGGSGEGILPPPVTAPVPEPATWGMLLLGFCVCGSVLRRRRNMPASGELGTCAN